MKGHIRRRLMRPLQLISTALFIGGLLLIIYDINIGHFLLNKEFGPGAYYFTDVPNWQHVFLDSPFLGFNHPVISAIFFVSWALLMYKLLCYLNDKL